MTSGGCCGPARTGVYSEPVMTSGGCSRVSTCSADPVEDCPVDPAFAPFSLRVGLPTFSLFRLTRHLDLDGWFLIVSLVWLTRHLDAFDLGKEKRG
jgi:hypothetical protein